MGREGLERKRERRNARRYSEENVVHTEAEGKKRGREKEKKIWEEEIQQNEKKKKFNWVG